MELGDLRNVGGLLRGVEGGREYGRHRGHHGVEAGHGEEPGGEEEVDCEKRGEDDDPGPDREEGGDQSEADRPVAGVEEEEGRGSEVRESHVELSVGVLAEEVALSSRLGDDQGGEDAGDEDDGVCKEDTEGEGGRAGGLTLGTGESSVLDERSVKVLPEPYQESCLEQQLTAGLEEPDEDCGLMEPTLTKSYPAIDC